MYQLPDGRRASHKPVDEYVPGLAFLPLRILASAISPSTPEEEAFISAAIWRQAAAVRALRTLETSQNALREETWIERKRAGKEHGNSKRSPP